MRTSTDDRRRLWIWSPSVAVGVALGLSIAASLFYFSNGIMLLVISLILAGLIILISATQLQKFIVLVLVTKPLIDLTWRWRPFEVFDQGVNIQSAVGVLVIAVAGVVLLSRPKLLIAQGRVVLFALLAGLSVALTPTNQGMNEFVRLASAIGVFLLAGRALSNEAQFEKFSKLLIISASIPVALSVVQSAGLASYEYWDWIEGQRVGRLTGTYQHPLGLLYYLVFAVPLAFYLLESKRLALHARLLLWVFIGSALIVAIFTFHRTALLTLVLEILIWMVLVGKYRRVVVGVILVIFMVAWQWDWIEGLYANLSDILEGNVPLTSPSFLRGRGPRWYLFISSYLESHPLFWIFGRGGSVAEGYVPGAGYLISNEPHSDFIRILHAYGLIGLMLHLSILYLFFRQGMQLRSREGGYERGIGNLMLVAIFAYVMLSITTEPMRYPSASWNLYALGSIVITLTGGEERQGTGTVNASTPGNPDLSAD